MEILKKNLTILIFSCFIFLQYSIIFNEPFHLHEPDHNCILCLAAQTTLYISLENEISYSQDIILYLSIGNTLDPNTSIYLSPLSIRAPPPINFI
jgi:hypothetical protein